MEPTFCGRGASIACSTILEGVLLKAHRVWIEIVLLGAAIACALALLIATLGAAAGAAVDGLAQQEHPSATDQSMQTGNTTDHAYVGMLTCSRCKAKHSPKMGQTAEICVRVCVHGGAHFALVNAETVYMLEGDLPALKKVAGERVRVIGDLKGNTIIVKSVSAQS